MYGHLVNVEVGSIERAVFDSPDVYQEEQRLVFGSCWLFLAHTSQLPRPGDFTTAFMGEDPVIVARHADGAIHAFLNVCRHRGMRVCRADSGHSLRFTCSFHGWSYDTSGALAHVPMEAMFSEGFSRDDRALVAVPRLEVHHGLIFGSWNLEAPRLAEYLGDSFAFLDRALDPEGGGGSELVGPMRWQLRGNWKLAAEQICGDNYHVTTSHASGMAALGADRPEVAARITPENFALIRELLTDYGHSNGYFPDFAQALNFPDELLPYVAGGRTLQPANGGLPLISGVGTIFPNFSHISGVHLRVYHPRGPGGMEVWAWVLVGADWPDDVKAAVVRRAQLAFSTTGVIETDDSENWNETAAVGGPMTQEVFFDYSMRRDPARERDPNFPGLHGRSAGAISDEPALNFYRRWAELMDGPEPRRPTLTRGCRDREGPMIACARTLAR